MSRIGFGLASRRSLLACPGTMPGHRARRGVRLLAILAVALAGAAQGTVPTPSPAASPAAVEKTGLPLAGATSKIDFTTNEGTWMSLDVSPDGQFILFDLLGDIYRLPIAGGPAALVTGGLGFDSQPSISPDGRRMAFISDRDGADNLWIARIDGGAPRKLSAETKSQLVSPAWTPDGQYVVVTVGRRKPKLRLYHVDGGKGLDLTGEAAAAVAVDGKPIGDAKDGVAGVGASFSPDGRFLYFAKGVKRLGRAPVFPGAQINRFDRQSGKIDEITRGIGGGVRPLVSPDGRLLVYATRRETKTGLRVRDLRSGADRELAWPIQRDAQETRRVPSRDYLPGFAFTPDSKSLVISFGGKIHRIAIDDGEVGTIPFRAAVSLDVGPDLEAPYRVDQGPVKARIIEDPRLSPDGRRLAMSILTKLYVMDAKPGAAPKRLTSGDAWEFKPAWSPDGKWIAYVTWSSESGGHIWKIRANGSGKARRLTADPAFYGDLAFSPDGTRIVALRGNQFQRYQNFSEFGGIAIPLEMIWLPAKGGEARVISAVGSAGAPQFAGEPERVYSYTGDALISMRYDGSDRRVHLRVEGPSGRADPDKPPTAERVVIRPDGRWALALVNKQIWVVPVPRIGGKAPTVSVRAPTLPVARITDIGADFLGWADGGDSITWAIGSTFFRRPFASIDFQTPSTDKPENGAPDQREAKPPLDDDDAVTALAVDMARPRPRPQGTILLRGANVIRMAGDDTQAMETVLADTDLMVTGNRIAAIGPRGSLDVPDGAHVVDVTGKFILPGFVDTHAHWEFRTSDVLEPHNWSLAANLAYGVTAGLDVQTSHKDYFVYRDMVETGQITGQRAFMTGPGIFGANDFQSYAATRAYLERYRRHYRTRNIKSYVVGNRRQRQWVVKAARELGLMPTTEGAGDLKLDLTHAIDGMHGNEHALTATPLYRDVIELYARTRTSYTPTLLVQYNGVTAREYFFTRTEVHDDPKLNRFYPHNRLDELTRRRQVWVRDDEFNFREVAAQAAKLQRAGGLVGIGGHGELQGLGYHWEMWAFAMGGMTPVEILRAATTDGARIIGIGGDLGSLEVGKLADLVVLDANPLDDIRNTGAIRYVMKNGNFHDGDTLDQLWPAGRKLPPFWWWKDRP